MTSNLLELETRSKYIVSLPLSHRSNATEDEKSTIEMKESDRWSSKDIGESYKSIDRVQSIHICVVSFEIEERQKFARSSSSVNVPKPKESKTTITPSVEDELLVSSYQVAENALITNSLEDELLVGGRGVAENNLTTSLKEFESSTLVQQRNFRANDREQELLLMTEMLEHENRYC